MVGILFLALVAMAGPALAQTSHGPRPSAIDDWDHVKPLFKLVEDVAAGAQAPSDVAMTWQNHFLKTASDVVLVPFTLTLQKDQFRSFPVAMYLRVVNRGAPAPAPGPRDPLARYPFEDVALFETPADGRFSRAFVAPAGEWDVYVALREKPDGNSPNPRTVVVKETIGVPDFGSHLSMSSVIVAERIEVESRGTRPSLEQQLDDPYVLWGTRITPAPGTRFDRRSALSVVFLVYNTGAADDGQPDVSVRYDVLQKTGDGDTLFGSTPPQSFNGRTLGPQFSLAAGDLVIGGQEMPLARFPDGDYQLVITVSDQTNGESAEREVNFTVAGPGSGKTLKD